MGLEFKDLQAEDIKEILPMFYLRPNRTCDSSFLDTFLWREFYQVRYAISDGRAVQWLMSMDGELHSAMPACREEDLEHYFYEMVDYFNQELKLPFKIYLADEEAVQKLNLDPERFEVTEQEDLKDYLYNGEALRTLSGRKLHKKKNNLNAFLKEYEGRYEYRKLCCCDRELVWSFLDKWREQKGEDVDRHLDPEVAGVHEILKNCHTLQVRMGGVFLDGELEAFSIGSYNPREDMAIIHIEKANNQIRVFTSLLTSSF